MGVGDNQCTNNNNKLSLYLYLYLHGTPLPEDRDIKDEEEEEGQYAPYSVRHVCMWYEHEHEHEHEDTHTNWRRKKKQHTGMLVTFWPVRYYSRLESCVLICACAHVAMEGSMSDVRACSVFASFL